MASRRLAETAPRLPTEQLCSGSTRMFVAVCRQASRLNLSSAIASDERSCWAALKVCRQHQDRVFSSEYSTA